MTEDIIERSLKLNRNSMKSIILRSAVAMVLFAVLGIVLKFYNPLNSVSRYLSLASAVSLIACRGPAKPLPPFSLAQSVS